MKTEIDLPKALSAQTSYKRKFNLWEVYRTFVFVPRAAFRMWRNNKTQLIDHDFAKRLQLAVTEVNGCPACSYVHTKMALRQGMSNEEIGSFLSGDSQLIKPEEAKAIMFAQHFADSRGYPDQDAYEAIVKEYGQKSARIILAVIQVMMAGNVYGIPYSAMQSRLKGTPFQGSSLFYELSILILGLLLLPIAAIHGILRGLIGLPNQRFNKKVADE